IGYVAWRSGLISAWRKLAPKYPRPEPPAPAPAPPRAEPPAPPPRTEPSRRLKVVTSSGVETG
ncbi:MAG TPA: hypothetical protein VHC69_08180, partial [Polyangiaceae bacterium]|nr:hypothetical protein [Polyangiaceae bacterium]